MRGIRFKFALVLLIAVSPQLAKADLFGSTVTGSITAHTPATSLTTQFSSPTTVGSGVEFMGAITGVDGNIYNISADFSATGLTVGITSPVELANFGTGSSILTLTFTDPAFALSMPSTGLTCNNDTKSACQIFDLSGKPNTSLIGDSMSGSTLTLNFEAVANGDVFSFQTPASTPEPSSLVLLGTGLLGGLGALRKRFSKAD